MNTAKLIAVFAVAACVAGPVQAEEPLQRLEHATVKAVYRSPYGSGIFRFSHQVTVVTAEGETVPLFSLSLSSDEPLPRPGDVCDFEYRMKSIELSAGPDRPSRLAREFERFECPAAEPAPSEKLERATVQAVLRSPFHHTGILAGWHKVTVLTREGETVELYAFSETGDDPLPNPGEVCDFGYHRAFVGAATMRPGQPYGAGEGPVLDLFACAPAA